MPCIAQLEGYYLQFCNHAELIQSKSTFSPIMSKPKLARITHSLRKFTLLWEDPKYSALFALIIYSCLAIIRGSPWTTSAHPYYNYLADAFLHGQFNLRLIPPVTHDLVYFNNQCYLYWLPMPAMIMMPFIAIFGVGFSDILFTLAIAVINVYLIAHLLRIVSDSNLIELSKYQRSILVLFFTLGTVHITLAPFGRIWFTGQLIGFAFTILAFIIAIKMRGWKAFLFLGIVVACAMLTRGHLVFIGLWPAYYLLKKHWQSGIKWTLVYSIISSAPLIIGIVFLGSYNWYRFGNIFDLGLDYHKMAPIFVEDYQKYGAFNWHYFAPNFYYQYISYPLPFREDTFMGGSLFLLSPLFFGSLGGIYNERNKISTWIMIITILLVNIPILLLMGTGWVQWGPRYTLDFTVPLLLLTAMGIRTWKNSLTVLLVLISIVHYVGGTFLLVRLNF